MLPFPSPGDLPDPGIEPVSPASAGRFFTTEPLGSSYCHTLKFFLGSQQFAHLSPPLNYELFEGRVSILLLFDSVPSIRGFPGGALVKNLPADAGDTGLILVSGRSPGEGNGNPLQYSCLENSVGYNPWGHKESDTSKRLNPHACTHPA